MGKDGVFSFATSSLGSSFCTVCKLENEDVTSGCIKAWRQITKS